MDEDPQPIQPPQWMADIDGRMQKQIAFARVYAAEFAHGSPGHLDMMTIATLAELLDTAESRKTAPGITAALHPTESIADAISAIEDIAELVGWPSIDTDRADDNFVITFKRGGL